ncbi:MAG: DHHA1 domain-containing protein, partial [Chloroflexota bacterium]
RLSARQGAEALLAQATDVAGVKVIAAATEAPSIEGLREVAGWLKDKLGSGVVALGAVLEGKPQLVVMVSDDLVARGIRAGDVVKVAAMGGGGGGRPQMAQAGGREPGRLPAALQAAVDAVRQKAG